METPNEKVKTVDEIVEAYMITLNKERLWTKPDHPAFRTVVEEEFRKVLTEHTKQFMECDTCRAKPGSPTLCSGCLHNRGAIEAYATQLLQEILDEMPKPDNFNPHSVSDQSIRDTNMGYQWGHNEYRGKIREIILNKAKREGLEVKEK